MHNGPPAVLRVSCGPEARPRSSSAPTIKLLATQRAKCTSANFRTSWDLLPRAPRAFRSKGRSGGRRCSFAAQREHLEHHLCRINVLLVSMQLGLGASMTGLGLFLKQLSPSLTWKECAVWAAGPLAVSGVFGLYFCLPDRRLLNPGRAAIVIRVWVGVLSFFCAIVTMAASVLSGAHGSWISASGGACDSGTHRPCCTDQPLSSALPAASPSPSPSTTPTASSNASELSCVCLESGAVVRRYVGMDCHNVISGLKDYLILQCALMGVASGVCLWLVVVLWQTRPRGPAQRQLRVISQRAGQRVWTEPDGLQCRKPSQKRLISGTTTSDLASDSGDTDVP